MAKKRDWIETMNLLLDEKPIDDRLLVELFIMWVDQNQKGDKFLEWLKEEIKKGIR